MASCIDVIASNRCPLAPSTSCSIPGTRIKIPQHANQPDSLDTEWTPSQPLQSGRSSFLDLPREIRDTIYDLIVPTETTFELDTQHLDFTRGAVHVHLRPRSRRHPSWLTLFCLGKQIHHEAAARLYGANIFSVECQTSGAYLHDNLIDHFCFVNLVPLHPAYARFVQKVQLSISALQGPPIELRLLNPHQHVSPPGRCTIDYPITAFISTMQQGLDEMVPCKCLKLIPLGSGVYILRRPPGPEREACKAATWKKVKGTVGHRIGHVRYGPRKRQPYRPFPLWFCVLFMPFILCLSCPADLFRDARRRRRARRGREDEEAGRRNGNGLWAADLQTADVHVIQANVV